MATVAGEKKHLAGGGPALGAEDGEPVEAEGLGGQAAGQHRQRLPLPLPAPQALAAGRGAGQGPVGKPAAGGSEPVAEAGRVPDPGRDQLSGVAKPTTS